MNRSHHDTLLDERGTVMPCKKIGNGGFRMNMTLYRNRILTLAAVLLACGSTAVNGTLLYSDNVVTNAGTVMGKTQIFGFVWGCCPIFDFAEITVVSGTETNRMAGLVAVDGAQGGHGLALHVDYNLVTGFPVHGLLQNGNVIRVSCWVALDPQKPMNHSDLSYAVIKIEFYDTELAAGGNPPPPQSLYDTDLDGGIKKSYLGVPTAAGWTQVVFEYTYSPAHFNAASLEEMRPVIIQGYDANTTRIDGNSLVDNLIVEIFANQAAANASPVDTTNPGLLPTPFVFFDYGFLDMGRTNATFVSFDGQPGVEYSLEYSETGAGGPWLPTGLEISGNGTRQTVTDPAGPSAIRTYRLTLIDPDFVEPL